MGSLSNSTCSMELSDILVSGRFLAPHSPFRTLYVNYLPGCPMPTWSEATNWQHSNWKCLGSISFPAPLRAPFGMGTYLGTREPRTGTRGNGRGFCSRSWLALVNRRNEGLSCGSVDYTRGTASIWPSTEGDQTAGTFSCKRQDSPVICKENV